MNIFPPNDFDRNFAKMQKRQTSLFRFAFGAWLLWAVICLAGAGFLVYVAWHFISKFW